MVTIDEIIKFILDNYNSTLQKTVRRYEKEIYYSPNFPDDLKLDEAEPLVSFDFPLILDSAKKLGNNVIYQVSFGISKKTYRQMFGELPYRPKVGATTRNIFRSDVLMPHPEKAWDAWLCILNPSEAHFDKLKLLFKESYELAVERYNKRMKKEQR